MEHKEIRNNYQVGNAHTITSRVRADKYYGLRQTPLDLLN